MTNTKNKLERIAKSIASTGYCSRRAAEKLISMGKVRVNEKLILTPAYFVSKNDKITIEGSLIRNKKHTELYIFHKPKGVIVSKNDPQNRKTIYSYLPHNLQELHYIGRLDYNTEGLLLLTNNGKLKRYFELPINKIERIYKVKVHGNLERLNKDNLLKGITINNVKYGPIYIDILEKKEKISWLNLKLYEGKNREIRKIMEYYNLFINDLIRIKFGPFSLNNLDRGKIIQIEEKKLKIFLKNIGDF
ncbi:MAG: pseudouridine synthase [Pelagibacterales bacterium]|nr:pseudouridine synthase [Pelagibacterales bacterium]PPR16351.1 MAG: Ribosomal large subunit pseudouridine synthase B [Alphaproteobacteria bacterium MarineAlpha9_Bin3]|tara:strand:- start:20359 stop:21099 length:741 start_codon:yes stop_codon:yes gene_type:complete